jgi:hypothetical protein
VVIDNDELNHGIQLPHKMSNIADTSQAATDDANKENT